ncbi:MAG: NAD-dependent epimerase/dehydratase family protein [Defluviitaleaceae bacterium]|nr:NAD-dependent epimerase/dehydratase family protein [Defluviitaleaceae bacterium]
MKNILITGETGYIARKLRRRLVEEGLDAECVSIRDKLPANLCEYDTVVHCAAMVHTRRGGEAEFYRVNTDLTRRLALAFKRSGGGQFIFMSTMAVYGKTGSLGRREVIDENTPARPSGGYGRSKLLAEQALLVLEDDSFRVAILRPPIVYGKGCPGNFRTLERVARIAPIFPYVYNERSMLHIDRLCCIIYTIINENRRGVFHPQDSRYHCTSKIVRKLALERGRRLMLSRTLGKLVSLIDVGATRKAFGSLVYGRDFSDRDIRRRSV